MVILRMAGVAPVDYETEDSVCSIVMEIPNPMVQLILL